jgi:acyl-CoA reductase-like NAD-dependent aldehyde dehydrogenase
VQATQELISYVPETTQEELKEATDTAAAAAREWKKTTVLARQKVMLDLQYLIRQNHDAIAENIVQEQGKTFVDAKGDVFRGLQVVEQACALTNMLMGEKLTVAKDMETCKSYLFRLLCVGVCNKSWLIVLLCRYVPRTSWCSCWYLSFQFPCHDSSLDVPFGYCCW